MTRSLLNKTSSTYLLFSAVLLLVVAPIFYYSMKQLYIDETDETLKLHKKEFFNYSLPKLTIEEVPNWNKYNRNSKIKPRKETDKNRIFFNSYYDTLDAEIEPYRELNALFTIEGVQFTYSERINLVETQDIMESIAFLFILVIFIILLGIFLITKRLNVQLWKPFYETLSQIEQFEIDKFKQPILQETNIEEFNRLNASIEKLIIKNTSIYQSQREFVENAAHELQTPLAVFQAKIDMFIQSSDFTSDQNSMLSALNDSVARLSRLNKNLLLLSKLEYDSYNEKAQLLVDEIINKQIDFFTEQARSKSVSIFMDLREKVMIQSNAFLLEIVISNLFLNAIKHNKNDGQILVKLTNQCLVFSNSGKLEPLISANLFNRFSKSNPNEKGNGLGLAIIKKIADLNDWKISYSFEENKHVFKLSFSKF